MRDGMGMLRRLVGGNEEEGCTNEGADEDGDEEEGDEEKGGTLCG